MAKDESMRSGPFLTAALICEKVLQEKDGVISIIRVIDRLTHTIQASELPSELPKVQFAFVIVVNLKSGRARGRSQVEVVREDPAGQRRSLFATSILFEGEDRGNNLVIQAGSEFDMEGVYWFDILLDSNLVTRIPFRMLYQLVSTGR